MLPGRTVEWLASCLCVLTPASVILLCVQHVTGSEDINWDNPDMKWVKTSSMARLHRFLTTRDLHYQWFNPLIFGLVPPDDDGVTARSALAEVEQMKSAALLFAKNAGWSDKVGLFVNVLGHNNVNSLFIHVLDMSELGPAFSYHSFKNCPLDDVIKVLREEAASNFLPAPVKTTDLPGLMEKAGARRRRMSMIGETRAGGGGGQLLFCWYRRCNICESGDCWPSSYH